MYSRFIWTALIDYKYLDDELGYEPFPWFYAHGLLIKDSAKMSKSRGNVVNPDEYIEKFGADTLRLYLMFMGPMDGHPDFRDTCIEGMRKFVERVWDLFQNVNKKNNSKGKFEVKKHQTIKKVTEDIGKFRYNTAIATIMEFVNLLRDSRKEIEIDDLKTLSLLMAPFTPHLSEEVWQSLNSQIAVSSNASGSGKQFNSVHNQPWPKYDPKLVIEKKITIPIQVNGNHKPSVDR
jgi:leucyl-tRNA synthetase